MARPRAFNEAVVIETAMTCFWLDGYEATSVRELGERMGLTSASLYNAFGDKHALFGRSLQHYVEHNTSARIARFEALNPPRDAIVLFLGDIIERSLSDPDRRGCFLVNSALELAPHDAEFAAIVVDGLNQLEGFFRRSAVAGQKSGTISREMPAEDIGRACLGALISIRVLARSRPEKALFEGLLRSVIAMLDLRGPC